MPSLIPHFEYDIFISYRQKDNKGDRWVTEFVNALKSELDATLKEDISIYFDENPHDGLLETHSVDKTLEAKLKSLILIPILSQTYCDVKSFAWQHEFCAFNKLAKEDAIGKYIKLANGNVADRILPIKIHDLDQGDTDLIENELGGKLRPIEFRYKEPGVNRPLMPTDRKSDNQVKIDYRNQVNKVANAVKDILIAIKSPGQISTAKATVKPPVSPSRRPRNAVIIGTAGAVSLALIIFYFGFYRSQAFPSPPAKSIAVLAFRNLSGDPGQEYFSDGVSEEIINKLTSVPELAVSARASSFAYKKKDVGINEMAAEMKVRYILDGTVRREKDSVRISVSLIDAVGSVNMWTKTYAFTTEHIFQIQSEISLRVIRALEVELALERKNAIEELPTKSREAYDLFLKGREHGNRNTSKDSQLAIIYYYKAIEIDPDFKEAKRKIAGAFLVRVGSGGYGRQWLDSALTLVNGLIAEEPKEWSNYLIKGWAMSGKGRFNEALNAYQLASKFSPTLEIFRRVEANIGWLYLSQGRLDEAFYLRLPRWRSNKSAGDALGFATLLVNLDEFKLARKFVRYAITEDPGDTRALLEVINHLALEGNVSRAIQILDSIKPLHGDFIPLQSVFGYAHLLKKNYPVAEGYYLKFLEAFPNAETEYLPIRTHLGKVYTELAKNPTGERMGAAKNAERYLRESFRRDSLLLAAGDQSDVIPYNYALINFVREKRAEGYRWLKISIERGFNNYRLLLLEPIFEKYRQDEEFKSIVISLKEKKQLTKRAIEKHYGMSLEKIPGIADDTFLKPMFIGLGYEFDLSEESRHRLVTSVFKGSGAEASGLKVGDKVIAMAMGETAKFISSAELASSETFRYLQTEGSVVLIKVKREGEVEPLILKATCKLVSRP
jgi:TolB-like protein